MNYHGRPITWQRIRGRIRSVLGCAWLLSIADALIDLRVCGRVLNRYEKSVFRNDDEGVGYTGSQQTHYAILRRIFSHGDFKPSDRFLDVGCGKGRVLAYLIKERKLPPDRINGVEINPVSHRAAGWVRRYPGVNVMLGNALELDYEPYTVLFLGRPFLPKTFEQFLLRLESTVSHPVVLIYWVDGQSGYMLAGRKDWYLCGREERFRCHGLPLGGHFNSYSIWYYKPAAATRGENTGF